MALSNMEKLVYNSVKISYKQIEEKIQAGKLDEAIELCRQNYSEWHRAIREEG